MIRRIRPALPLSFFNHQKALPDKIPEGSSYGALRHLQFPGHGGDGRPAHPLPVGPAPQVQVHGDGPAGQFALINSFKVCHLLFPFPVLSFFCQVSWRGVSCPPAPAGVAALSPLAAGVLPGAGTFPGWPAPRLPSRHRPQAGCPCPEPCTAPQRRYPTGRTASASPSWGAPRFSSR